MDVEWYRYSIHYYIREKYYGKAKTCAKEILSQQNESPEFLFYLGLANILEGQIQQGVNELTPLQSDKDLQLAVVMVLVYSSKLGNSYDREDLYSLETKLKEERKQASSTSFYYAGLFLSFAEKYDKASDHINKSLRKDPNNIDTLILKGWNDMLSNISSLQKSTLDCFELVLHKNDKQVGALMGSAKFKYFVGEFLESNMILDKVTVRNPRQIIPLMEKLKNEFATMRWESIYDIVDRILSLEKTNIEAIKMKIYISLCKNSDNIEAVDQLNTLFTVLENEETNNGYVFYNITNIFSRVCGRSSAVLSQVYRFVQYASEMYPNNVDYLCEVGYQCLLQTKYKDALNFFKAASKIDSNSIVTLCGLTLCQMYETGPTDQIAQQVELLYEMQGTNKYPILYLLTAQLNNKNSNAITFLNKAIETQISQAAVYPIGLNYIKLLDPDFLLGVYKEYQKYLPKKPLVITGYLLYMQENNSTVVNCEKILSTIYKACPGLLPAVYELAKLKFLYGSSTEALKLCQHMCELDNTHPGSQVLLAQIYIQQKLFTKASQSLEMCLSYNFKVRDSAMYHFLQGIVLKNSNQEHDALSSLTTSLQILTSKNVNNYKQYETDINIIDKATLYLEIIQLQTSLGLLGEAGKMMQEAIQEIAYTSEESRLSIARADFALHKGDIDGAIDTLNEVKPGQPYYFQAHSRMAHIYLKEKRDNAMFTNCFKEIVSNHPMADAQAMMGDAFISIHEPIQAAEAYQTALKGNYKDIELVKKLGLAFYKMHEYDKAVQHYENAIQHTNDDDIKMEYYELLIKLKQYDKVDSVISSELNQPYNKEKDIKTLKRRTQLLLVQARSREIRNPSATNTNLLLAEAKELQTAVLKRVEIDARGDVNEEKEMLSRILCSLAKAKSSKEPAVAAHLYSEALIHCPREPSTLLALAKLFAQMNNTEKCEQTCAVLLHADPTNESAAVMMADLAFRKVDLEAAQRHLNQILSVGPRSWQALAQLVEVQWRRGALPDAVQALQAAQLDTGDKEDLGYEYCAGLCAMYEGKVNAALRHLNQARRSPRWGRSAAKRMVLLCLSQYGADGHGDGAGGGDESDTRLLALRTAEKLLTEVAPADRKALQAHLQLATKQKSKAERVLQDLLPLVSEDGYQDDPFLILAIANAYNLIKQPTRAKNILKRTISAIPWTPENAEGLERCWLEVADNQINSGRMEVAKELLGKILNHNSSCAAAYQHLGYIAEKEQNYKMAAHYYDKAWVNSGNDLGVGYKLAQAYLKLKRYPECIVVCRAILKVHPDYPKIKKEIFEKAKANLRT